MGLEKIQLWAGGQRVHRSSIREEYLRERQRLLFKLSLAESESEKEQIRARIVEVEELMQEKFKQSGYSIY